MSAFTSLEIASVLKQSNIRKQTRKQAEEQDSNCSYIL